jgi:predicted DCC family thiol-disulfide oxidoreductase YuxK
MIDHALLLKLPLLDVSQGAYLGPMDKLIVWFDGGCALCRQEIDLMRRLDRGRRISFLDVSDETTVCPLDRKALLARFHAQEDGRVLSGAAAFAAMWRAIPVLRPLGLAAKSSWFLAGLEKLYRVFLCIRPRLQSWARALENRRLAR